MNYDMNLNQDQVQNFVNKIFEADKDLVLDKDEIKLARKILFSRTREFRFGYIGSGNIIDNIERAVSNCLYKNEDWYQSIK